MSLRIGELFAGYCGLGMGVRAVIGGEIAWVSDVCRVDKDGTVGHHDPCRAPCSILAHRYPGVPNHGDITAIDWATVEPVDVLTGGFPCQDVSTAGARAGLRPGTRSGLWAHMAHAIQQLKPRLVVIENVRGLYSAPAHSDVEPCPVCVGDDPDRHMRALGAVLADLADIGYDAVWCGLRASDVGAPHGRFRVFIAAYPEGDRWRLEHGDSGAVPDADDLGHERRGAARRWWDGSTHGSLLPPPDARGEHGQQWRLSAPGQASGGRALSEPPGRGGALLPTPVSRDYKGASASGTCLTGALLPTPSVADAMGGHLTRSGDRSGELLLPGVAKALGGGTLLPTPRATDGTKGGPNQRGSSGDLMLPTARATNNENRQSTGYGGDWGNFYGLLHNPAAWGEYAPAIRHWEALTRPAPAPTIPGRNGSPRLSPAFPEWMMGLPAGWVTDVPGITRNEALKAIGNGVVPQQAAAATRWLLDQIQTHALDGAA